MKFYIKRARGSYTNTLFEAKQVNGQGKPKFSVAFIIEPTTLGFFGDANPDSEAGKAKGYKWGEFKAELSKVVVAVAQGRWSDKAPEVLAQLKAQNRLPLHDGMEKGATPGYAGNHYMNASNEVRPMIRNKNGAQLEAKDGVIYSGCYLDGVVDIWAQDNQHGKRVNASLMAVIFNSDGERLAGGATVAEDDYAAIPEGKVEVAKATGNGAAGLFSV